MAIVRQKKRRKGRRKKETRDELSVKTLTICPLQMKNRACVISDLIYWVN